MTTALKRPARTAPRKITPKLTEVEQAVLETLEDGNHVPSDLPEGFRGDLDAVTKEVSSRLGCAVNPEQVEGILTRMTFEVTVFLDGRSAGIIGCGG